MKNLLVLIAVLFLTKTGFAQDRLYLVFEFMNVDNDQEMLYSETEAFWEKIHEQRVKNGDIIGWDLWRLQPGGEDQGYQYLTVNLFNDPVKMMSNAGDFEAALNVAYPEMPEEDRLEKFNETSKSRDLAKRLFLEQIATTSGNFDMPLGTVAGINFMKATDGDFEKYENFESEIFRPMHQKEVDEGLRGSWGLFRYMLPTGSDAYATHLAVDMYENYQQLFNSYANQNQEWSQDEINKFQEALASRDLKYKYMATLIRKVR